MRMAIARLQTRVWKAVKRQGSLKGILSVISPGCMFGRLVTTNLFASSSILAAQWTETYECPLIRVSSDKMGYLPK